MATHSSVLAWRIPGTGEPVGLPSMGSHLISDKIDLNIKTITRDKEGHYILIKGSIQEEDITIANIYASNIGDLNT